MGFLKKVGIGIAKGAVILAGLEPLFPFLKDGGKIGAVVDRVQDTLGELGGIIVQVEAVGAALKLDGAQKLTAAAPLVAQLVKHRFVAGKKIADQAQFDEGVAQLTNGIVAILNSIDADEAKTT